MAGSDLSEQLESVAREMRAGSDLPAGCNAGDLKSLLNTIVDQIAEADRRHSDTLQQLQERLAGLGREAQAIKPRLPDRYAPAFERIETGMAELASRIAEAAEMRDAASIDASGVAGAPAPLEQAMEDVSVFGNARSFEDAPAALRAPGQAVSPRQFSGVDTFDIIESDPPSGTDPWDRDAAEALTDIYDPQPLEHIAAGVGPDEAEAPIFPEAPAAGPSNEAGPFYAFGAPASMPDKQWLEDRFVEIAKRIEESLNDVRPDQGFFALNQRVDQFEQNLSAAFEGIATRGDVEGVHLIEAHVSELAGHLENAHNQLLRLDEIERQLMSIAGKLDDVHHAASGTDGGAALAASAQPNIDMDSFARTAAEAAAAEFSKFQPAAAVEPFDTAELSAMLRDFISESRQGDENTIALLDTMQQAMIRLLDRVDSLESLALSGPSEAAPQAAKPFAELPPSGGHGDHLDAAVAAVASARPSDPYAREPYAEEDFSDTYGQSEEPVADASEATTPERLRQDFIAEARRTKMRLAAEAEAASADAEMTPVAEAQTTEPPLTSVAALRGRPRATKVAPDPAEEKKKKKEAAGGNSRLRTIALAGLLVLGGLYATMQSGLLSGDAPATAPIVGPAGEAAPGAAPAAGSGPEDLKLPEGTRGEIVPGEFSVGATTVPLYGVAVDAERPITAEGLERAQRQQAMAAVSSQLGEAAARNGAATAIPAALNPADAATTPNATAPSELSTGGMSRSSALDLPPATVGPLSLRLAAAKGDPSAEFEVGARLAEGKGTDQTFNEAAKWYQRAASKGLAQAQYRLGTLYERGLGVKQDKARAQDWYRRAAEQGNIKAMHNLAVLRANATSGSPDYMNAALWFEKAAERGLSDSQFNLAVLKENGLGVPKDMVSAYKWLSLAAKGGDKEAERRRDILKGKLTTAELTDAEKRVATFRTKRADPEVNDAFRAGEAWKKNSALGE